jgi:hypothetical protein
VRTRRQATQHQRQRIGPHAIERIAHTAVGGDRRHPRDQVLAAGVDHFVGTQRTQFLGNLRPAHQVDGPEALPLAEPDDHARQLRRTARLQQPGAGRNAQHMIHHCPGGERVDQKHRGLLVADT